MPRIAYYTNEMRLWLEQIERDWANPSWRNLLVTLPWAIGALSMILAWNADHNTAKRERTTIGVVTARKASRSIRYQYTFSVNGEKHEGSSTADDRHDIGDEVTVFYDPIEPTKSALRDYRDLAIDNLALAPLALTGIAGFTWYIWYARSRNKVAPREQRRGSFKTI